LAIQFARLQYVKRSAGQSVCHKAAYNGRLFIHDERLEKTFNYTNKTDSVYHAILLPEGAVAKYQDPEELWNTIEAVEGRWDSQVGKEMVLALPDDSQIVLKDRIAITCGFVEQSFVKHGLICQVDIHSPEDKKDGAGVNWHAHVLMTTRPCLGEGFGKKARHLDVAVREGYVVDRDKQWGWLWAEHQNGYFKEQGIPLQVDPIGITPNIHLGPVRMRGNQAPHVLQRSMMLYDDNRRYAQQEDLVLRHLTKENVTFTKEDVRFFMNKHIDSDRHADFLQRFFESDLVILVGQDHYTSRLVLDEERKPRRVADRLSVVHHPCESEALCSMKTLTEAQQKVCDHVLAGPNLTLISGVAGSGKSHVINTLKNAYEDAGYTVRGFAPQAQTVTQMKQNGFSYASNVRRFLFKQYYEQARGLFASDKAVWINPGKEVWLVDVASSIANPDLTELLDLAWSSNAKVVLCGDENQKPCQGRGGAFSVLKERYGAAELNDHSRQQNDDQKQLVAVLAEGKMDAALDQMIIAQTWRHHGKEFSAVQDLLSRWYASYQKAPENSFMILDQRQSYVRVFNERVHDVLKSRGDVAMNEISVETAKHGLMRFSVGDSIVFMQDDEALGVTSGVRGKLVHAAADCFKVHREDCQKDVVFDPHAYDNFQHGYASQIHSAQGQTFDHVFVLHSKAMDALLFYIACSHHVLSCEYFSSGDQEAVRAALSYQEKTDDLLQQKLQREEQREGRYLDDCVALLCDVFYKDHDYYRSYDFNRAPSCARDDL